MVYRPTIGERPEPQAMIVACVEQGAESMLLDAASCPDGFFDLSTGVAGDLLHRLSVYHLRLAVVVEDLTRYSRRFQEFAREANQGRQFRFFDTSQAAEEWLNTPNVF